VNKNVNMKKANLKKLLKGIVWRENTKSFWLNVTRNGKRQWFDLRTADETQAIRKAAEIRATPDLIQNGDALPAIVDRFVADMKLIRERGSRDGWSESTAATKIYRLLNFAQFIGAHRKPESVTSEDVKRYYNWRLREHSAQTAVGSYMTVRSFFNWCVEHRLARTNPALGLKVETPEPNPRQDFCEPELVRKLIDGTGERDDLKFILYCGFHCGMRKREIIEAVPWWFDLKRGHVQLRKTPTIRFKDLEERTIPLTEEFRSWLKDHYGLQHPFMLHPEVTHGASLYRYEFEVPFMAYMKAQKCEWVTPHIMRHTFASLNASLDPALGGPNDLEIAKWMGIDLHTYQRTYAHLRTRSGAIDKAFAVAAS
jgi:integrase